jgi:uncharacterized protein
MIKVGSYVPFEERGSMNINIEELDSLVVQDLLLTEIIHRVTDAGSPLKIVLFGSQARGDAHPSSDLDLLVIEESNVPRYKRAPRYYRALAGVSPTKKDIIVWTPAEIQEWSAVPNAFITTALREGKVIYERPA